ncbi:MAG: TonB-dependent receptor family protein [Bacteroides sp.]|nr:TonB-dependent receptor family protein [Bacteroides sp.]
MPRIISLLIAVTLAIMAHADTFSYRFKSTPLPQALRQIMDDHNNFDINFIYNELENYKTSAVVNTDNAYDALRQTIGFNPVTVVNAKGIYYVEALQQGKYVYFGRVVATDGDPLVGATVLLLAPKDSTVMTYGVVDSEGGFSIPCDRQNVVAKILCIGYKTKIMRCTSFNLGTIVMDENALELKSVTVNADLQSEYSDRSVFIPTARQKRFSDGAIDLLYQMAIPMVKINLQNGSVTTNSNMKVAIYINKSEATARDLEGLNPEDVKTVEYLINPMDPRFQHAQYVINITLRKIEYGGYTKLQGRANLVAGSGHGLAYTKFNNKRMTYDLSLYDYNLSNRHGGSEESQTYTLGDGEQVVRDTKLTDYHVKSNRASAAFRARYEDDSKSIANRLTVSYTNQPHSDSEGRVTFSSGTIDDEVYRSTSGLRTIYPTWKGEYFFNLGHNISLNVNPQFHYYHVNSDSRYRTATTDITTIARENVYEGDLDFQINKQLNNNHGLSFMGKYAQQYDKVEYTGTTPSVQKFRGTAAVGLLTYMFKTKKLYGQLTAGGAADWNHIDGKRTNNFLPAAYLSLQYAFDRSRSLQFMAQIDANTTDISTKGGNIVRSNEYLYLTGNPELKDSKNVRGSLSYNWTPSNELSVSADLGYFEIFDRPTAIFVPYMDGKAILRTIENDGNYAYEYAGLSFTSRLLDKSLTLSFKPQIWFYQTTGEYDARRASFVYELSARYYLGKFYISGFCNSGEDMLVQYSMWSNRTKTRLSYGAAIGWSNSHWTLRVTAHNPFRDSWVGERSILSGKYFSSRQVSFSNADHQWFCLTATYTFKYGKKVRKGDEISADDSGNSAIMK